MALDLEPGEAAQVDPGCGPVIDDPELGRVATWIFVMTAAIRTVQPSPAVRD